MLLSPLSKKTLTSLLCALAIISSQSLNAKTQDCSRQSFNIKTTESLKISEVVNELASKCGFSVVTKDIEASKALDKSLDGLNINNMSLHEVFNLILSENGISYSYKRKILKLSSLMTRTFKLDYITSIREGTADISASSDIEIKESGTSGGNKANSGNEIKVKEKFDFWQTLNAELLAILNNGSEKFLAQKPIINKNTGLITVTATKPQLDRVDAYLKKLKQRLHKQVLIDVSIIEVKLDNAYKTGIDWSQFSLGINSSAYSRDRFNNNRQNTSSPFDAVFNGVTQGTSNLNILSNATFNMVGLMNFIKKRGDGRMISSPKVMTLNNQQALITVGDNINYRVKQEEKRDEKTGIPEITYTPYTIFIGVLLNILPEVSDDNKIMLRINPSLSEFKYKEDDRKQDIIREVAPDTVEKKLSTVVQVNSGDTIILGGLLGHTKGKYKNSVPVLGSIPVLGHAFRSTNDISSTKELVFVITPRVLNADTLTKTPISKSLKDLGFSESLYE